jgi:hypothetical protein
MIAIIFKLLATLTALATTVLVIVATAKSGFIVLASVLGIIKLIVLLAFLGLLILIAYLVCAPLLRRSKS